MKTRNKSNELISVVRVSTTIPIELHEEIKNLRYKVSDLVRLGFLAKKDNPQIIDRIRELEKDNRLLDKAVKKLQVKITEIAEEKTKTEESLKSFVGGLKNENQNL